VKQLKDLKNWKKKHQKNLLNLPLLQKDKNKKLGCLINGNYKKNPAYNNWQRPNKVLAHFINYI